MASSSRIVSETHGALLSTLAQTLRRRHETGRFLETPDPTIQANAIDFGSNDILSISSDILREELLRELHNHPGFSVGNKGTRVATATSSYAADLEAHLANFHNAKDALLFNSGFDANVAIWSTIPQPDDVIVYDELVHVSILDGMKLSRAKDRRAFLHNDLKSFQKILRSVQKERPEIAQGTQSLFVAVESVYSMDGDMCPIRKFVESSKQILPNADIVFVVDEAHSNGIFGPKGSGIVCLEGLEDQVAIRMHTFSKAMGCTGGVVLCDPIIRDTLFNYASNFVYAAGPTFMNLAAIMSSYRLLETTEMEKRRYQIQRLVSHFYHSLMNDNQWKYIERNEEVRIINLDWISQDIRSPLVPIMTKPGYSRKLAAYLLERGMLVHAVQYPVVPQGLERIRIVIHAENTLEEVGTLVKAIIDWAMRNGRAKI